MQILRSTKKIYGYIFIVLTIFLFTSGSSYGMEKATLRLKWVKDITSGGPIVAKHKGFFENNGLDLDVLPGGFDLDPIKLVATGSDTFGVIGADTFLLARAKGIPIVAIGVEYQQTPVVFISKKESGITQPKDFIGKRVGVKFGLDTETIYRALLAKLKINSKEITEVPLKWDMTPFFVGSVDVLPGYLINEPLVAKSKGFDINIIKASDYGMNFYGNVYFTSVETLRKNPQEVENFLSAVIDGWWYVFRHKEESVDICLKAGKDLDRTHQIESYDAMLPLFVPSNGRFCWMTSKGWEDTYQTLLNIGLLKKPLDLEKSYTMEYLKKAYK